MVPLYEFSVPVYLESLKHLREFLQKSEKWYKDNRLPTERVASARLFIDMQPLAFHVATATNCARLSCVRITGVESDVWDDNMSTYEQFYERIDKTVAWLKELKPEQFEDREDVDTVLVQNLGVRIPFKCLRYQQVFGLPNFFFHITTIYAILRVNGVPLGKFDYVGTPMSHGQHDWLEVFKAEQAARVKAGEKARQVNGEVTLPERNGEEAAVKNGANGVNGTHGVNGANGHH